MNITFFIGNGFDRNLGLATTYSEFVKVYKKTPATSDNLRKFREHIDENEELWSSAEIALGKYTEKIETGMGEAFSECHTDICEELAKYLKGEQERINYRFHSDKAKSSLTRLNSIVQPFPTQERSALTHIFSIRNSETHIFNFINFNYTDTLDRLIDISKDHAELLGSHRYSNQVLRHSIGQICHVHGTVDGEMVFGVNDDTQIAKNNIFDCEDGDLFKRLLIKQQANAAYLENTDARAAKILNDSQIIYIYGMSIGETDKLWWQRVCQWLLKNNEHHLIYQKYKLPDKGVLPTRYQLAERKARKEITRHSDLDDAQKHNIENRIHITDDNIFEAIKNIADLPTFRTATAEDIKMLFETV